MLFRSYDANSNVACETLVTTGQVVLAGEVKSSAYVDLMEVARRVINRIGYTRSEYKFEGDSCGVFLLFTSSLLILIEVLSVKMK